MLFKKKKKKKKKKEKEKKQEATFHLFRAKHRGIRRIRNPKLCLQLLQPWSGYADSVATARP